MNRGLAFGMMALATVSAANACAPGDEMRALTAEHSSTETVFVKLDPISQLIADQ